MSPLGKKLRDRLLSPAGRRFVGVDFDSRQLRVVQGERVADRTRIVRLSAVRIPEGIDTSDPQVIGSFLGTTLKRMKIPNTGVVMSVPRGLAVLKPLTLPPGTAPGEMASMVQFQMGKELPFRPEEAVIDYSVERHYDAETTSESDSQGVKVLVAAVRIPVVDYYRQIALAANVKLRRLGLRPHANQGCVVHCVTIGPSEHVAVVHLTADETEIDVLAGRSLAFSRSAMGKIPLPDQGQESEIDEAVSAVVVEATRSLQSYQAVEGRGSIDRVYIAGGTGVEQRVAERLSQKLAVRCELLDPAAAFDLEGEGNASEYISALGLAIRHSGGGGMPFDFLHPKRPVVRRDLRKFRIGAVAACAVLAIVLGVAAGQRYLENKKSAVQGLIADKKTLGEKNAALKARLSRVEALEDWRDERCNWLDHWAYLSALLPSAEEAFINRSPGFKGNAGTIKLAVRSKTSEAITKLVERLRKAGYEPATSRFITTQDDAYVYSVDLKLTFDPKMSIDLSAAEPIPRPPDDQPGWVTEGRRDRGRSGRNRQ
ncbi:MAG TPA: pilus assembly protein PilM [Phycisphaerae bacterium]|nr:pilus assembly protein PilM [Phycisphaerae bacterium]